MDEFKQGKHKPYIFHVNWNHDGVDKEKGMAKLGLWFVEEKCRKARDLLNKANDNNITFSECCS